MSEENLTFKKDETPYIVFLCMKCKQYLYVKTTQATKKCLRCRHNNKMSKAKSSGYIVNGLSLAIEAIKEKQNELAFEKLGESPDLRAEGVFVISVKNRKRQDVISKKHEKNTDGEINYTGIFKIMLNETFEEFKEVPFYVIELKAEDLEIPKKDIKLQMSKAIREGILIPLKDNYYTSAIKKIKI